MDRAIWNLEASLFSDVLLLYLRAAVMLLLRFFLIVESSLHKRLQAAKMPMERI